MKRRKPKIVSDINVTSLVDVTFVLLIIFIISAPFMRSGMKVELPRAVARQPQPHRAVLVVVNHAGQIAVNGDPVTLRDVGARVGKLVAGSPGLPVLLEGDTKVAYGTMISVMDMIRQAGIENVGLVLEAAPASQK